MYDEFAEDRLRQLPALVDTDWEECRRRLSRLYFASIQLRLNPNSDISHSAITQAIDYLRRLANTLEQYLFNEAAENAEPDLIRARSYAFIAAEAIDLWCNFTKVALGEEYDSVELAYARVESALLYMASDYQVNAHCSTAKLQNHLFINTYDRADRDKIAIDYLQKTICAFTLGNLSNLPDVLHIDYQQFDVIGEARTASIIRIAELITNYCQWLSGQREENVAEERLQLLIRAFKPDIISSPVGHFADLLHLSTLLLCVVRNSATLSMIHQLPRPEMNDSTSINYERYLSSRAVQRPFLWPSAKEYIEQAFPGPHSDAVVVVPTGSGKSYLAELASSQAMQNGWVLYLAPTNALVNQVQRDLRKAFATFEGVQILPFIGGQEYTNLSGELLDAPPNMSIAVMTPEKCAVAFRINPNVISNCKLCIVDEFHTINDSDRGITLDLCLAQVLTRNPETRLLLMSAMVSNGAVASDWLKKLRNGQEVPLVQVPWRPCRTLRSLLIVDIERAEEAFNAARSEFQGLPATRKNVKFNAPLALIGGMRLQWQRESTEEDYVSIPLPLFFESQAKRGSNDILHGGAEWKSWKNAVGQQLSEEMAKKGLSVLCFILTSKHHVFSTAEKCNPGVEVTLDQFSKALLDLADAELGVESTVGELLRKGIGVHSSAMLDSEQRAVETNFRNRKINLLFATPTLAQGLNLPADVVVVAGSSLGGEQQTADNKSDATILNAFGRAGRAMIANHGLAVLVSDKPYFAPIHENIGVSSVVDKYPLLGGTDKCVEVASPIASFIERLTPDEQLESFSMAELELVAQLGDGREQNRDVLGHTFGAYIAQRRELELSLEAASGRIRSIEESLLQEHGMPEWLPQATMKSGLNLLTCWRMWRGLNDYIESHHDIHVSDMESCLQILVQVMRRLPPKDIRMLLPDSVRAMNTMLDKMLSRLGNDAYASDWEAPDDWAALWTDLSTLVWMHMNGKSYALMAAFLLEKDLADIDGKRNQGHPIPAIFSFVSQALHHLSIYAGALQAIIEGSNLLNGNLGQLPLFPLCIRNGCNNRESLAWFRYGYRNRMIAHEFARIYPVPAEIQDEASIRDWIANVKRNWLNAIPEENESLVLRSARVMSASA